MSSALADTLLLVGPRVLALDLKLINFLFVCPGLAGPLEAAEGLIVCSKKTKDAGVVTVYTDLVTCCWETSPGEDTSSLAVLKYSSQYLTVDSGHHLSRN